MKDAKFKLLLTTILMFVIPPVLVVSINYINGLLNVELLLNLLTEGPLFVITGGFYIAGPYYIVVSLNRIKAAIEEKNIELANKLYKRTANVFFAISILYGLCSIPITYLTSGFTVEEVVYSAFVAVFYLMVANAPFFIIFIKYLDKFYEEIEISEASIFSIKTKLKLTTFLSSIGGVGLIASSFYIMAWKISDSSASELVFGGLLGRGIILLVLVVILQVIPNVILGNIFVENIKKIQSFALKIANKNLTEDISLFIRDEFGLIAGDLNSLNTSLKGIISKIIENSVEVNKSSEQLKSVSTNFSNNAMKQASSAEELAASMEEMTANINMSHERSIECQSINKDSEESMLVGQELVDSTLQNMQEIEKKVTLIDRIAGQTNLLAINASIEASNAGKHGLGFSVVAKEVRRLADSSKEAANEITKLTEISLSHSQSSKDKISEVVPKIQQTLNISVDISKSSEEQKSASEQINTAVQQFNKSSQDMAQSSGVLTNSSARLSKKTNELETMIKGFKV